MVGTRIRGTTTRSAVLIAAIPKTSSSNSDGRSAGQRPPKASQLPTVTEIRISPKPATTAAQIVTTLAMRPKVDDVDWSTRLIANR